jgi:hypothetical protein
MQDISKEEDLSNAPLRILPIRHMSIPCRFGPVFVRQACHKLVSFGAMA